mmetsp:Transcript_20633/g.59153  ORF Transcript_20633/g.59153 Transcript_20633/m.59153 type:complete len:339 (+) Transcript_20633:83-1099(+)
MTIMTMDPSSPRAGRAGRRCRRSTLTSPAFFASNNNMLVLAIFLALSAVNFAHARDWTDVINVKRIDKGDRYRWKKKIEVDPLLGEGETSAPVAAPTFAVETEAPTIPPNEDAVDVSRPSGGEQQGGVPTMSPTFAALPTSAPTTGPTERNMNINGNGGCPNGEFLMALFMYDGGSDGWDDTKLALLYDDFKVQQFAYKGGLESGASGIEFICLRPDVCYTALVDGTVWLNEISWEIRPVVLGKPGTYKWAVAKGRAPAQCQFSFGNQKTPACESTCLSWDPVKPTLRPTRAPTRPANAAPAPTRRVVTPRPTKAPTLPVPTTSAPSPDPTLSFDDFL